jgi:leucyl aminopeptidase
LNNAAYSERLPVRPIRSGGNPIKTLEILMEYNVKSSAVTTLKTACLVVGVYQDGELALAATHLDKATRGRLKRRLGSHFDGKTANTRLSGEITGLRAEHILFVGLGHRSRCDALTVRKAAAAAIKALLNLGVSEAASLLAELPMKNTDNERQARTLLEASEHALYRFDRMKSKPAKKLRLKRLTLLVASRSAANAARRGLAIGTGIARGVACARDLGNLPSNVCTPSYLAREARKLARKYPVLKVRVLGEAEMKRLGMGALLGVARGSHQPPRLIIFEYNGGRRGEQPIALVGKGVTFDAGGISLKPAARMDEMKFDMCGAAGVFGTLVAACELELPINLVGLTPAVENLPGGNATKPGDILTSLSGQTIEVVNTDAEGRLILGDALTYVARFKPRTVVDMATLTGACVVALGPHASGLMSHDDKLAAGLLGAGERAGDRAWRLPLWEDYQPELKSNFADFSNLGGREGGAITAGCFLSRFTQGLHWAHLDIAGSAWLAGADKGATGRPVPLLVEWLLEQSGQS